MNDTTKKILQSLVVAKVLTAVSYAAGLHFGWIDSVNWLEAFSVFTSYACTYLCVVQSRTNYYFGVVSVAALSLLFFESGLYASMALNIYLIPTLLWGWYRWGRDEVTRPVTFVKLKWWPVYIGLTGYVWYGLTEIASYLGATLPATDSFILAGSILAQFLLDQKKIENWAIWAIINVVAIYTYWNAGLVIVALQFIFFLANTVYGAYMWNKSMKERA